MNASDDTTKNVFFIKKDSWIKNYYFRPKHPLFEKLQIEDPKSGGQNTLQYGLEMVKHQRNWCLLSYFDNAIFESSKIKLILVSFFKLEVR